MIIIQELDKQIEALEKQSLAAKKKKEKADALAAADSNGLQFGKVTILQNNEQRTQYTPTIKLLKRDPAEVRRHNDNPLVSDLHILKLIQTRPISIFPVTDGLTANFSGKCFPAAKFDCCERSVTGINARFVVESTDKIWKE